MKFNPFTVQKQTGKQTIPVAAGPIANGTKSVALKYADTTYYQVGKNGDYVQEQGG